MSTKGIHMLKDVEGHRRLFANGMLKNRKVLELGVGTGMLTKAILDAGATGVLGCEIQPGICAVQDPRLMVVTCDYTQTRLDIPSASCLVANPAYSTLDFIKSKVLSQVCDAVLMVPEKRVSEFEADGFRTRFVLSGDAFDPPATGKHVVMSRGFSAYALDFAVDLHAECAALHPGTRDERVAELARRLPSVALCAMGGIPVRKTLADGFMWATSPFYRGMVASAIREALGFSAVLTYTNPKNRTLEDLGDLCASLSETWAYHWFTLSIVFAGHPQAVEMAFARDSRFKLSWPIEETPTGRVFVAHGTLKDWLRFTKHHGDGSGFDVATCNAMLACHHLLDSVVP